MEEEEVTWKKLCSTRQKCLLYLFSHRDELDQVEEALEEIKEIETLLAELWKRVEVHARKPTVHLSKARQPLKSENTLATRWMQQVVLPLVLAAQVNDLETNEEMKNSS